MNVVITKWGLDSYLELKHNQEFTPTDYWASIRPDVLLLKTFPGEPKFGSQKFWSPATFNGHVISDGFKMKWHQLGPRRIQLRLPIGLLGDAYLCRAYVKNDPKSEARQLAKFKTHLALIREGKFHVYGRLT